MKRVVEEVAARKHRALVNASQTALEAYDSRFESVGGGNIGPIDNEMDDVRKALEALAPPADAAAQRAKYRELPLGARFRYVGYSDVFVKLSNEDCGLVAQWEGPKLNFPGQGIYSFADSRAELETLEVIIADDCR